jgi:hypothetical protein
MHPPLFGNGTELVVLNTSQLAADLAGSNTLQLGGTNAAAQPVVSIDDGTTNTIGEIIVGASRQFNPHVAYFGEVIVDPFTTLTVTHGVKLLHGSLLIANAGVNVTLGGLSIVGDGSTLTLAGGRSQDDPITLNGILAVGGRSVVDSRDAPIQGGGLIDVEAGGTVDLNTVRAGLHIDVDRGGMLLLQDPLTGLPPSMQGVIREGSGGLIVLDGAVGETKEVFHTATGVMDLLSAGGAVVAALDFAVGSREYAAIGAGGAVDISSTPIRGGLPVSFTH